MPAPINPKNDPAANFELADLGECEVIDDVIDDEEPGTCPVSAEPATHIDDLAEKVRQLEEKEGSRWTDDHEEALKAVISYVNSNGDEWITESEFIVVYQNELGTTRDGYACSDFSNYYPVFDFLSGQLPHAGRMVPQLWRNAGQIIQEGFGYQSSDPSTWTVMEDTFDRACVDGQLPFEMPSSRSAKTEQSSSSDSGELVHQTERQNNVEMTKESLALKAEPVGEADEEVLIKGDENLSEDEGELAASLVTASPSEAPNAGQLRVGDTKPSLPIGDKKF